MCAAMGQLRRMGFNKPETCKQLLQREGGEPQLLTRIVRVVKAALQQLGAQGHSYPNVSSTAAMLCDTLLWLLLHVTEREVVHGSVSQPAKPAAAAHLGMMLAEGARLAAQAHSLQTFVTSLVVQPSLDCTNAFLGSKPVSTAMPLLPCHPPAAAGGLPLSRPATRLHCCSTPRGRPVQQQPTDPAP